MMDFFSKHFDAVITSIITILGFIITYLLTKQSVKDEIRKDKINRATGAIQELPFEMSQIMDKMKSGRFTAQDHSTMISKVFAYGSKDAVKIAIKMQRLSYTLSSDPKDIDKIQLMAAIALLITQLKYDLTSEIISPESWFLLKITDYEKMRPQIKECINSLIFELELNHVKLV